MTELGGEMNGKSLMRTMSALATFIAGYTLVYGVAMAAGLYAVPVWGGEDLLSLWLVIASLVPGMLLCAFHGKRLSLIIHALIGAVYMALQVPTLLGARVICDALSIKTFFIFFMVDGALLLVLIIALYRFTDVIQRMVLETKR